MYSFFGIRIPLWDIIYPLSYSYNEKLNIVKIWFFSYPLFEINYNDMNINMSHSTPLTILSHGFQLRDPKNPQFLSREHILQLIYSIHTIKQYISFNFYNTKFKLIQYEFTLPLKIRNIERKTFKLWISYIPFIRVDFYKIQNTLSKSFAYKTIISLYHSEIES